MKNSLENAIKNNRNWTVLFIGGASGMGKSSAAYEFARFFSVNVMEVDDVFQGIKAMTTIEKYPNVHYWSTGINWKEIGIHANVNWLTNVSKEIEPSLKAIVENHLDSDVPVIIEGDFIHPEFVASFDNPKVKAIYIHDSDRDQVLKNYFSREGGELQHFRADVSSTYGAYLAAKCTELGIPVAESRPWDTVVTRMIEKLL